MNAQEAQDSRLRINDIQIIGTHNSYHAGLAPSEKILLRSRSRLLEQALDYSHLPLDQQLASGIRQIELDVFADPDGGRYADPKIRSQIASAGLPPDPDFDPLGEMRTPGFKVMHMQDTDQRSTCHTLRKCLGIVQTWSSAHPEHLPVFILVECKQARIPVAATPDRPKLEVLTPALFDSLDAEIRSIFSASELVTPDEVRGHFPTLPAALAKGGWPSLAMARGRVIFLLDNRDLADIYSQGHPALRGRLIFPNEPAGTPESAFTELNNGTIADIAPLVRQGYLVRTRADSDTLQARSNDTTRRDAAIASGAQIVSTDYPLSEPARWTHYAVGFADQKMARCNPIRTQQTCSDRLVEPAAAVGR